MKLEITNLNEFNRMVSSSVKGNVSTISEGMRKYASGKVAVYAEGYSDGSSGIGEVSNVKYTPLSFRDSQGFELTPHTNVFEAFKMNALGHNVDNYVYVTESSLLRDWVSRKYHYDSREEVLMGNVPVRIRSRDASGYPPLGSKYRNFFGRAYVDLINELPVWGIELV